MNELSDTIIEIFRIITGFLTNNSNPIVIIVLLVICREPISNLISRLTSLTYKKGDSKLGMVAAVPERDDEGARTLSNADEKPAFEEEQSEIEEKEDRGVFHEMFQAFDEGRLDDAELVYKRYAFDEKDKVKLQKIRAVYLNLLFVKGRDNSAIGQLEELARNANTEDTKYRILKLLSDCFYNSMQYKKEIELWQAALEKAESELFKTKIIVNIARTLAKEERAKEAKSMLVDRLSIVNDDEQTAAIYRELSNIEMVLGDKSVSIYCKDKSLEFDVNNRDELFNSAYSASEEDVDEISISNYINLIRIDEGNSTATNNLGVRAQEVGLNILAVDHYKRSSSHNNTLAMANQGYLLLNAGFTDEAEKLASEALKQENTHQNIHSLLVEIAKKREEQKEEWEKLREKSFNRQKLIRKYIEQYYLGESIKLEGDWLVSGSYPVSLKINDGQISATWDELGGTYTAELVGTVSGSTIKGNYVHKRNGDRPRTVIDIGDDKSKTFIGFVSEDAREINLISTNLKDDFSLCLSRQNA
ncbi:MAG: hypothetical protein P8Y45_12445 [Exilibacterium sp.]